MSQRISRRTPLDDYVSNKVKEMRMARGFTQAVLAIKLGVSATFISDIENPKKHHKYNISHLNRLAKVLECSPRDFLPERPC